MWASSSSAAAAAAGGSPISRSLLSSEARDRNPDEMETRKQPQNRRPTPHGLRPRLPPPPLRPSPLPMPRGPRRPRPPPRRLRRRRRRDRRARRAARCSPAESRRSSTVRLTLRLFSSMPRKQPSSGGILTDAELCAQRTASRATAAKSTRTTATSSRSRPRTSSSALILHSPRSLLPSCGNRTYADGSHCGQSVKITRSDTGQSITAKVADSCPTW